MPRPRRLRRGDWVVVRSPEEILATLDASGTLDGLPFMPEMLEWCGKAFRVERRAEKTCVDVPASIYPHRRFVNGDVVLLDDLRCDGEAHEGCKRACKVFWKEAWLRPGASSSSPAPTLVQRLAESPVGLKTKTDDTHFFCQSTQLQTATVALRGNKKMWRVRLILRELRNGDRSLVEVARLLMLWSWQRLLRAVHGDRWPAGPHVRAPTLSLGLEPGEVVRIKRRADLRATLDRSRGNRGLRISYEMTRYCGGYAEVRDRMDRMIDERTGEMREIQNTVTLRNVRKRRRTLQDSQCLCWNETGDCPRGELMYWREIWLERVNSTSCDGE